MKVTAVDEQGPVQHLSVEQCWALLARTTVGRLAVAPLGEVDVFPVHYRVEHVAGERRLLFGTGPGTKLVEVLVADAVAFEVDDHDGAGAWSVVVKGVARQVDASGDPGRLEAFAAVRTDLLVEIVPTTVSGRRFSPARAAEPGPEA